MWERPALQCALHSNTHRATSVRTLLIPDLVIDVRCTTGGFR